LELANTIPTKMLQKRLELIYNFLSKYISSENDYNKQTTQWRVNTAQYHLDML